MHTVTITTTPHTHTAPPWMFHFDMLKFELSKVYVWPSVSSFEHH